MPQISKIRIVNFQYNDGKRLIADELYDFEIEKGPSDALINLANGGGKSVLVQLMMQPIIPKAKVAGRKIESFFTKATDHCTVAIEWALDGSKTKLMTGIAMAAGDSANNTDADRGFQVKYYTFIANYQNYQGNYNIIHLPLSKKENGKFVPASFDDVRNLAKKSGGGLERYSSEDAIKWAERLAEYGIIQNEWRMIEELNSNEDGLSKYFSSLKTSDAVIDKLIIPRIEEKQNHGIAKDDSSLEMMLLSYAKQFSRQQDTIREREILSGFLAMLSEAGTEAEELWKSNDSMGKCIEKLFAYSDALNAEILRQKERVEQSEAEQRRLGEAIRHIQWEKVSAEFYTCKEAFERETARLKTAEEARAEAKTKLKDAEKKLLLLACAHYFSQLKELESRISALSEEIENRENNSQSAEKLASLKYSAYKAIQEKLNLVLSETEELSAKKDELETFLSGLEGEMTSLQKRIDTAKSEADRAAAVLDKQMQDNDASVEELGIGAFRMLDGKYQEHELKDWQSDNLKKEQTVKNEIDHTEGELQRLETRRDEIPGEIAMGKASLDSLRKELQAADERLSEYHSAEERLKTVYEKHGLDFSFRFTEHAAVYLKEQKEMTEASIQGELRQMEVTEEAIAAIDRGMLHIPKLMSSYLESTGIHYVSVEKYILTQQEKETLSKEACLRLLESYPFAAYGVIVEQKDKDMLCPEAEGRWLPSVLPIFTAEDIERMLSGDGLAFSSVAAYAKDYFRDSASYAARLQDALAKQRTRKQQLEERKAWLEAEEAVVKAFSVYDEAWEKRTLSEKRRLEASVAEQQKRLETLQQELNKGKENIDRCREEEKELRRKLSDVQSQCAAFDKLAKKLEEENALSKRLETAQIELRNLQTQVNRKKSEKDKKEVLCNEFRDRLTEAEATLLTLRKGLEIVAGATEAEILCGEWSSLLAQYEELLSAQNADLKRLNDDLNHLLKEADEKRKEIQKRGCRREEYETLIYTEKLETSAGWEKRSFEADYHQAESEYAKASRCQGKAESALESIVERLREFGGEALPMSEIGPSFDTRIAEIDGKISEIRNIRKTMDSVLLQLQKLQGKADAAMEQYDRPAKYENIALEADCSLQLEALTKQIREWKSSVSTSKSKVGNLLKKMSEVYGTGSADVRLAISSMQELLSAGAIRGDRYFTLCEHIDANAHTAALRISQIDTDLKEFHKTKEDLIHQCVIQGKQMYEGLRQLSVNSKVKVQDKRKQMLKFDIPDAVDETMAGAAISAEIDKGTEEIVSKMTEDSYAESDVRKIAQRTVGSKRLLRKYIGSENIVLKAYKIDRNPDNSGYRTWEQTQVNNSGAEKFVVYFAVILALMAYTRDGYDDLGGRNNRSVLILDNPFGPISSKHVLEPMFEISKNYNVQMICLSDISKADIVSCFDLVIRAVVKQFALSSKEQLTHEGNESIEHGFYCTQQMSMF